MPNYTRWKFEGGYYFFTVVTYRRRKLFLQEPARECLRQAIHQTKARHPYESVAACLLPEHLHCVWRLPDGDADFSIRWSMIKGRFSQSYLKLGGPQGPVSPSRQRKGEAGLWQRRFWEHQIRDERDLQRHVDYVHYNPVKHGLVRQVADWPWSTYHRYVKEGFYGKADDFDVVAGIEPAGFGE